MSTRNWAAAAACALTMGNATIAGAADLYGQGPAYQSGQAYDDPRYADIYRHPAPPPPRYAAPAPAPSYYPAPPPPDRYLPPMARPPVAYGQDPRWDDRRYARTCAPRHVVREDLERRGWYDMQPGEVRGEIAHIRARRGSGHLFDLTIDRCSGQVYEARLVQRYVAQAPDWRTREGYRRY